MAIGVNVTMRFRSILYLTLIVTLLTGCDVLIPVLFHEILPRFPRTYSSQSIEGWVVDSDTGEPLKDVVVVADWTIWGGIEGGSPKDHIVHEAVTDAKGHYYIPAWGPTQMPTIGSFQSSDPWLIFFKEQYEYTAKGNDTFSAGYLGYSEWSGKSIKLKRFQGDALQYDGGMLEINLRHIIEDGDGCGWMKIPLLLREASRQNNFLKKHGRKNLLFFYSLNKHGYISSNVLGNNESFTRQCGQSPKQFFKDYLNETFM